ncbi:integrase, catalytic region, zinc finger, CCHC-type containing protein [Tanacetum coccineum]
MTGIVINEVRSAIVILTRRDLMLAEEKSLKMLLKKRSMMLEKKGPIFLVTTKVEVPKDSQMVNTSLRNLNTILWLFDVVSRKDPHPQPSTKGFGDNEYQVLNENERLLEQVINKDIVNIIMNSSVDNVSMNVHECEKCLKLETELLNKKDFVKKEKVLEITALKDDLRKLKGKALVDNVVTKHTIDPEMLKIDVEPITPKLLNKRTAHSAYIKHTQEEAAVLRDLVDHVRANYPLDHSLESTLDPQPSGNTKKDKIRQTPSSTQMNKVEAHLRKVKSRNHPVKRKPTALENKTPKPVVTLVYSREPRKSQTNIHVSKSKIGNVTILRVYYVEGLGHNLFSVGQFYDLNLEVAFCQHTCFIRNLEGVDLLTGSRGNNLYTLSLRDMMASSPICLLSKASKTKSWLWHRLLSHLNFGTINHLARHGLVRGIAKLKFKKDRRMGLGF